MLSWKIVIPTGAVRAERARCGSRQALQGAPEAPRYAATRLLVLVGMEIPLVMRALNARQAKFSELVSHTWKVRLIEEDFHWLLIEMEGV